MRSLNEHLNEGAKSEQVKRKYAQFDKVTVGIKAPVRSTILSFIGENGKTKQEIKDFLKIKNENLGTNTGYGWILKNDIYFTKKTINTLDEKGNMFKTVKFKLSKIGKRVLDKLKIWEN